MAPREALTDLQLLDMLDRMDRLGESAAKVAEAFGVTRSSICGLRRRVTRDYEASVAGSVIVKLENMDGHLGPRWWAKVAQRRKRVTS